MQLFKGIEYIKIDIANKFGLDKDKWDDRLKWFELNEFMLRDLLSEAEEPAQYLAGINEDALKGIPSGYLISLDATASGAQILCCLTGDLDGAKLCNLVNTGNREDLYTNIYNYMVEKYNLPKNISRDKVKKAIMTALYSSIKEPEKAFGKRHINHFYETMLKLMPGAWRLNIKFLEMWQSDKELYMWTLPDNFHSSFKSKVEVEDTFTVNGKTHTRRYKVVGATTEGRALGANITHSIDGYVVREITARAMFDRNKLQYVNNLLKGIVPSNEKIREEDNNTVATLVALSKSCGMASVRLLEHLNSENIKNVPLDLIKSLISKIPSRKFSVLSVHDCFRCLPNYGNDLRQLYKDLMCEIADSCLLEHILEHVLGKRISITKRIDNLSDYIKDAEYPIT